MLPPVFLSPAFNLPSQVWRGVTFSGVSGEVAEASAGEGLGEERKKLNIDRDEVGTHSKENQLEICGVSLDMAQKSGDMSHVQGQTQGGHVVAVASQNLFCQR